MGVVVSAATVSGFDLFMRHTDTNGKQYVALHRVWDKDLFLNTRAGEAEAANAKVKNGKAKVEQITEAQYLQERLA